MDISKEAKQYRLFMRLMFLAAMLCIAAGKIQLNVQKRSCALTMAAVLSSHVSMQEIYLEEMISGDVDRIEAARKILRQNIKRDSQAADSYQKTAKKHILLM